jgi:hypothetical protein
LSGVRMPWDMQARKWSCRVAKTGGVNERGVSARGVDAGSVKIGGVNTRNAHAVGHAGEEVVLWGRGEDRRCEYEAVRRRRCKNTGGVKT